jgi:hypothetical protein
VADQACAEEAEPKGGDPERSAPGGVMPARRPQGLPTSACRVIGQAGSTQRLRDPVSNDEELALGAFPGGLRPPPTSPRCQVAAQRQADRPSMA